MTLETDMRTRALYIFCSTSQRVQWSQAKIGLYEMLGLIIRS